MMHRHAAWPMQGQVGAVAWIVAGSAHRSFYLWTAICVSLCLSGGSRSTQPAEHLRVAGWLLVSAIHRRSAMDLKPHAADLDFPRQVTDTRTPFTTIEERLRPRGCAD